jgi:hypothetical protein
MEGFDPHEPVLKRGSEQAGRCIAVINDECDEVFGSPLAPQLGLGSQAEMGLITLDWRRRKVGSATRMNLNGDVATV